MASYDLETIANTYFVSRFGAFAVAPDVAAGNGS
jgi:hypothetical protein